MAHLCTSCNLLIETNFKDHFKTDWHLYNLKRKVASLPPISQDDFNEKLKLLSSQSENNNKSVPESFYCDLCHKKFAESGPYQQHLQSKQHAKLQSNEEKGLPSSRTSSVVDSVPDDTDKPSEVECIALKECLFCGCLCGSVDQVIRHMENKHSFFIPDKDALKDVEGLLACLGDIIASEHRCLLCLQAFSSMRSTRQHMLDKDHTRLQAEGDAWLIYADFYDFEATGEYESDSDEEDEESEEEDTGEMAYERVLPSGAVIGCRALRLYYRQYLPNTPTGGARNAHLRALPNSAGKLLQLACRSRGGDMQVATSASAQSRKWTRADMSYLQRSKQKYHMKLGIQTNKLQKHFRVEENF